MRCRDHPEHGPELTLVYLPHLDYDPQRHGPSGCDMARLVCELDEACAVILDTAAVQGYRVWIVSEYGHADVEPPVHLNRSLRQAGLLKVRTGPFGEVLDTFGSQAFAVCDHQVAHIYVRSGDGRLSAARGRVDFELCRALRGSLRVREVAKLVWIIGEPAIWWPCRGMIRGLRIRTGWMISLAPDFARTVDIHRKPGYDPCELFFDPKRFWPQGRAALQLARKKLGFRTLFDVIPLDREPGARQPRLCRRSILRISRCSSATARPRPESGTIAMTETRDLLWRALVPD